jgi:cell division protein FtsL
MTPMIQLAVKRSRAFTLFEALLYLALLSTLLTGIISSIYPIMRGALKSDQAITEQEETLFINTKINYALQKTVFDSNGTIIKPAANSTSSQLIISRNGLPEFNFFAEPSLTFCDAPLQCEMMFIHSSGSDPLPLTSNRVSVRNVVFKHLPPTATSPRSIILTYVMGDDSYGPVYFYVPF